MESTCNASRVRQLVANPKAQLELRSNLLGYLCSPESYDSNVLHTCNRRVLEESGNERVCADEIHSNFPSEGAIRW